MANKITVKIDVPKIIRRTDRKFNAALPSIASAIREDCNEYVRVDKSTLRQSSYIASDLSRGRIIWRTPYARRVYYTGKPSKDVNSNASLQWCEKAKAKYLKDWRNLAARKAGGK